MIETLVLQQPPVSWHTTFYSPFKSLSVLKERQGYHEDGESAKNEMRNSLE